MGDSLWIAHFIGLLNNCLAFLDIDARLQVVFIDTTTVEVINGSVTVSIKNGRTDTCGVVLTVIAKEDIVNDNCTSLLSTESHLIDL